MTHRQTNIGMKHITLIATTSGMCFATGKLRADQHDFNAVQNLVLDTILLMFGSINRG
jgi:hypothetical protein